MRASQDGDSGIDYNIINTMNLLSDPADVQKLWENPAAIVRLSCGYRAATVRLSCGYRVGLCASCAADVHGT